MLQRLVLGLLATAFAPVVLSSAAHAGPKFQYLSQSVIVLEGIPSTRPKADVEPKTVAAKPMRDDGSTGAMTAEERRLLRYGLEEETERQIAEADRGTLEEETAKDTMVPVVAAAATPARAPEPAYDDGNTTITIEAEQPGARSRAWKSPAGAKASPAAVDKMARLQEEGEAPDMPERKRDPLPKYEKDDDGSLPNDVREAVDRGNLSQTALK